MSQPSSKRAKLEPSSFASSHLHLRDDQRNEEEAEDGEDDSSNADAGLNTAFNHLDDEADDPTLAIAAFMAPGTFTPAPSRSSAQRAHSYDDSDEEDQNQDTQQLAEEQTNPTPPGAASTSSGAVGKKRGRPVKAKSEEGQKEEKPKKKKSKQLARSGTHTSEQHTFLDDDYALFAKQLLLVIYLFF